MIAGLLGIAGTLGVVAWYLQRRPPHRFALSFARLLPDPPDSPPPEPRLDWRPPVRSLAFWLHLLAVICALVALWLDHEHVKSTSSRVVGVRFVVDTSYSMSAASQGTTRLEQALNALENHRKTARELASDNPYCDEVYLIATSASGPLRDETALAGLRPSFYGGDKAALIAAAKSEARDCPITYRIILTDLASPTLEAGEDPDHGSHLLWHQIGDPLANSGILAVAIEKAGFLGEGGTLSFLVAVYGEMRPPSLTVQAPDGTTQTIPLVPSLDRDDQYMAKANVLQSGEYRALIDAKDGLNGDNQVTFQVSDIEGVALNWMLPDIPPPSGVQVSETGLIVIPLSEATPANLDRPILATKGDWPATEAPGRVGAFLGDHTLVEPLNLDVVERFMPDVPQAGLPAGFHPVLTNDQGNILIAERLDPPGFIVPEPRLTGHPDSAALSLTVFMEALEALVGEAVQDLSLTWHDASGQVIPNAWKESDTARALAPPPALSPPPPDSHTSAPMPVWPYLVLATLALLISERAYRLVQSLRTRSPHAL